MKFIKDFTLNNIKLRIRIKKNRAINKDKCICSHPKPKHRNFCILQKYKQEEKRTFSVFRGGSVNITGIRDFRNITDAIKIFCHEEKLNWKKDLRKFKTFGLFIVDNLSFNGHLQSHLSLKNLNSFTRNFPKGNFTCVYDISHFPGLFLQPRSGAGRILIFRSGKFCVVGLKCYEKIIPLLEALDVHIQDYMTTSMKEQQSV